MRQGYDSMKGLNLDNNNPFAIASSFLIFFFYYFFLLLIFHLTNITIK